MILACRQLHKAYGIDVILEKITFHIEEREKAAIVGVNGAGKTTVFNMLTESLLVHRDVAAKFLPMAVSFISRRTHPWATLLRIFR